MAYLYQKKTRKVNPGKKNSEIEQVLVLLGTETSVEMAQFLGSSLCSEPVIWWYDEDRGYHEGASKWNAEHPESRTHYIVSAVDLSNWELCRFKIVEEA